MSVFIKVDKLGTGKRLFRSRGLSTTFGEDHHGILTSENPEDPIFTLNRLNENALIQSHKDGLRIDGNPLKTNEQFHLGEEHKLTFGDYNFTIFNIPAELEVASHAKCHLSELLKLEGDSCLPTLSYSLAMFKRSFPIPENTEIIVGSSHDAGIQIDLKQVKGNHLKLINRSGIIEATPLEGEISFSNMYLRTGIAVKLSKTTAIRLEPTNFEILIEIPAN